MSGHTKFLSASCGCIFAMDTTRHNCLRQSAFLKYLDFAGRFFFSHIWYCNLYLGMHVSQTWVWKYFSSFQWQLLFVKKKNNCPRKAPEKPEWIQLSWVQTNKLKSKERIIRKLDKSTLGWRWKFLEKHFSRKHVVRLELALSNRVFQELCQLMTNWMQLRNVNQYFCDSLIVKCSLVSNYQCIWIRYSNCRKKKEK